MAKTKKKHVRDLEWERLLHYARAMNVKVILSEEHNPDNSVAEWSTDGGNITIWTRHRQHRSKLSLILTLIHELGHQVWFVHQKNREPDLKFEQALSHEFHQAESGKELVPKALRKKIYQMERDSSFWWDSIYKETDMKFPFYRLEIQRDLDVWMYEFFYENGTYPTEKQLKVKKREVVSKYKARRKS